MFDSFGEGEDLGDDDFGAELTEGTLVYCPYCAEAVEITLDASGGETQEYVEDCEVCCQPWSVRVTFDPDGTASVDVQALDE